MATTISQPTTTAAAPSTYRAAVVNDFDAPLTLGVSELETAPTSQAETATTTERAKAMLGNRLNGDTTRLLAIRRLRSSHPVWKIVASGL